MGFQAPLTIKDAIDNIDQRLYLLPAIQREFVWSTEQIEVLFDSLLQGYPISSFLFWDVKADNVNKYQFYEFIRNYHERENTHNTKAKITNNKDVVAILDGQQRLTSLYIGLKGSYAYKLPRKRWDNPNAYPKRKLYLNILSSADDIEKHYDFTFLTEKEAQVRDENTFWFQVENILSFSDLSDLNQFLIENDIFTEYPKEKASFANKVLSNLFSAININPIINFFLEKSNELDKVLNIFIRVNSGGTKLSYSDLLLSIATAQWSESRDAREEINELVDNLNAMGDGFHFTKDFVLKSCLVLCDLPEIAFKVDNFDQENMAKIEAGWDDVCEALILTTSLIISFGYCAETLTSYNALIPVAYYLYKKENPHNFVESSTYKDDRDVIKMWLTRSLLKRAFSGQPDNVLRPIRRIIRENNEQFPINEIIEEFKGKSKSIVFTDDDIENLLTIKYGTGYAFSTLAILYPSLDYRNKFHQDHIHPKSYFTKTRLKKAGIDDELIPEFMEKVHYLPNLQLLEATPNIEKQDTLFNEWLEKVYPTPLDRQHYYQKHYIDDSAPLDLNGFLDFYNTRAERMRNKLKEILNV